MALVFIVQNQDMLGAPPLTPPNGAAPASGDPDLRPLINLLYHLLMNNDARQVRRSTSSASSQFVIIQDCEEVVVVLC
jgi:hypothetical protein